MAVEFHTDSDGRPYGVYHIPLRVRYSRCPWSGDNWLKWIREHCPRPPFRNGKTWGWAPHEAFIPPEGGDWVVESFEWWAPKDPDGLPPVWKVFQREKSRDDARQFCIAWRAREERQAEAAAREEKELRKFIEQMKEKRIKANDNKNE